jgi:hypothetical protein
VLEPPEILGVGFLEAPAQVRNPVGLLPERIPFCSRRGQTGGGALELLAGDVFQRLTFGGFLGKPSLERPALRSLRRKLLLEYMARGGVLGEPGLQRLAFGGFLGETPFERQPRGGFLRGRRLQTRDMLLDCATLDRRLLFEVLDRRIVVRQLQLEGLSFRDFLLEIMGEAIPGAREVDVPLVGAAGPGRDVCERVLERRPGCGGTSVRRFPPCPGISEL